MSAPSAAILGVIGGSGLYEIDALSDRRELQVDTPFGSPSDALVVGTLGQARVAFLARHGRGHKLLPTEINYRANVYAMKSLGVRYLLSSSAVGSLKREIEPLHAVLPDQFVDRTRHRADTFFGDGIVAHVSLADPICASLSRHAAAVTRESGATVHEKGIYVCMEGPQFSTRAESELYRSWGADVIGMTNLQEARLAREAELCYATIAWVTDYDCWKTDEEPVTVDAVVERLKVNAEHAKQAIEKISARVPEFSDCGCHRALDTAIITPEPAMPTSTRERLALILDRALGARESA